MKVTALMPDELVSQIDKLAGGKNLTESLLIALREWLAQQNINRLNERLKKNPLQFKTRYTAHKIRSFNRKP